jgi:hypothetical protein
LNPQTTITDFTIKYLGKDGLVISFYFVIYSNGVQKKKRKPDRNRNLKCEEDFIYAEKNKRF